MRSQTLNRYLKKTARHTGPVLHPRTLQYTPIRDDQTGFIHHPRGFPIEFKRVWFSTGQAADEHGQSDIGLIFESEKYFKPGITIEITIPVRNSPEKFRGKVVLVRHNGDFYEIGLWLKHRADAGRARIVEQFCHIETYLKDKKFREGPYILNPERVAAEWITKYASSVPSF